MGHRWGSSVTALILTPHNPPEHPLFGHNRITQFTECSRTSSTTTSHVSTIVHASIDIN